MVTSGTAAFERPAAIANRGDELSKAAAFRARLAEFLFVGGATLFLFPLSWLLRKKVGLDASEYAVGFLTFYGAYLINDPHFTVTYFLFYKDVRKRAFGSEYSPAQRIRYVVAGLVVPACAGGVGRTRSDSPLRSDARLDDPAHVSSGRLALREAGLRRGDRSVGATRCAHRHERAQGHPRSIASRTGPMRGQTQRP